MALHTLGTNASTSLSAVKFYPPQGVGVSAAATLLSPSDLAAISQSITSDVNFAAANPAGILATGTTHSSTTLDTLVSTAGGPLASIQLGALVLGVGITPGTFVIGFNNAGKTSVLLSQAATASAAGVRIGFINPSSSQGERFTFNGFLEIPGGRGRLIVKPGDIAAIDNTGWPILLSAASLAYAGSLWTYT